MKRVIIICFVLIAGIQFSNAQPGNKKEKIEALKIAFITDQLALTPEEAQLFWPVFNKYEDEMEVVRKLRKTELMAAAINFDSMSDADISKVIDNETNYQQQELDLRKKYIAEFKKVLPIRKVAKLLRAEQQFKLKLLKEFQDRQNDPDSPKPPLGGPQK